MKKKIFIIEDDEDISLLIEIILTSNGYGVVADATGDILDSLVYNFPDLIILDINLEHLDGRDICKKIKSNPLTQDIPVIFLSAINNLDMITKTCGADDYLSKPFEVIELLEKIETLLSGTEIIVN